MLTRSATKEGVYYEVGSASCCLVKPSPPLLVAQEEKTLRQTEWSIVMKYYALSWECAALALVLVLAAGCEVRSR